MARSVAEGDERRPGRLLEQVRAALELRHYSVRTVDAYVAWVRRFVLFHERRHPSSMGAPEVAAFLSHLASAATVSASTQNQALAALLFLYSKVLGQELGPLGDIVHARRPARLPVVMTREEVATLLSRLDGTPRLMASLLYGSGLRLQECVSLRVKDLDLGARQIMVRRGKGKKDRPAVMPQSLLEPLEAHLGAVQRQHASDLADGAGCVALPDSLRIKYPVAPIRTIQKLLGHSDIRTTMIYTHVLNRGPLGVKSPLDQVAAALSWPKK